MKLAKGLTSWVVLSFILMAFLFAAGYVYFGAFFGCLTVFMLVFFRDPERDVPTEGVLSPADGRVMQVHANNISIFMNLHNVHVNRSPVDGTIEQIEHVEGSFKPAFSKDSEHNERNIITISTEHGDFTITQIAGSFARRIVCYVDAGDSLRRGQRIGIIRFGSRVDVSLPDGFEILVGKKDKVRAGETVIARLRE